ncbi:hypothetical protein QVD17_37248 [Tagetes erecta]|uniref:Glabrous enhancer-binding protein-like DBD domain-containing protein n=1 Tax=Tagetes erecta TaxID=13708 RepID=A0AAD8JTW3_TARER|nr:hypothetical protein QVD17_37248 [Tagetes erecta]
MVSQQDDHITTTVFDVEEDNSDDSDDEDLTLRNQNEDNDVDLIDEEEEDESTSSGVNDVTIAVAGVTATATPTVTGTVSSVTVSPIPRSDIVLEQQQQRKIVPVDESRRLFQRLWTDEDEIELLQGFLEYNNQRVVNNPFHHHHHHHDTTAFYDQIKDKLQLDFNKNQLVEKLRRLKKKYRNVLGKISSGKDYVFKSAHDQITFDISCKIWNNEATVVSTTPVVADGGGRFDDDESNNPNFNSNLNVTFNLNEQNSNGVGYGNSSEKKIPRSRKRSRSGGVKIEEKVIQQQPSPPAAAMASNSSNSIPNLVEETVKSCLLPLFKELLEGSSNVQGRGFRGLSSGGMNLDPFGLSFGGLMSLPFGDVNDEKWRKQHILELEVCSKRLELVQDQIKSQLEELKSMRR